VDLLINTDDPEGVIAIIEIKVSDWDGMTDKAVRRNVQRQVSQDWNHLES